jgi:hypothetical protein
MKKSPEDKDAEVEAGLVDWDKAKDEKEETKDADDPEMPNLENMLETFREGIRT